MNLRLRLTLVTVSVVTVMGIVSLVSFELNRRIQSDVERLDRTLEIRLDSPSVIGRALSLEGHWQDGQFIAEQIEKLPSTRRPKLRGTIEAITSDPPSITLYGQRIAIKSETEYDVPPSSGDPLHGLKVADRADVSCRIEADSSWTARKIETRELKKSDKIKGTITSVEPGPGKGNTLRIERLPIYAQPGARVHIPRGPIYRLECATQMSLAVQECLTAANELLKERYRKQELHERGEAARAEQSEAAIKEIEDRVADGQVSFAQYLTESRTAEEDELGLSHERAAARSERIKNWLAPLDENQPALAAHVTRFTKLAESDLEAAQLFLKETLEPFLRTEVMTRIHAYALATEENLSDEMELISQRSDAAARLELLTNAAGFLLAIALGLIVSRSITKPILALKSAAQRIGSGQLDTRVKVTSGDEIGILAGAFNRMGEELAKTTVSVANLREVQEELRRSLQEKDLLLHEVHHRVKNNLQVISSLLALQSHSISDPPARARFQESQDLIQAIVFAHEQLHRSRHKGDIDLHDYLELLTSTLAQSHAARRNGVEVSVQVEPMHLDVDRAQLCGLIVNELVTNAFKHAFRDRSGGEIRVVCHLEQGRRIVLEVADDGLGFAHDFTRAEGETIGLSLVSLLTKQLHGELAFDGQHGASYHIAFPQEMG